MRDQSYKGEILASSSSEGYLGSEYRRPRVGRQRSIFDDDGDQSWREDFEVLTKEERARYRRICGY
jgi:hypothetical protein